MCAPVHSYIHGWSTLLCTVRTLLHTLLGQLSVWFLHNFVALQRFLCLRLQDSMRQTAPQESQNLYANRIQISKFIVKGRWFSMLASMELYARAEL